MSVPQEREPVAPRQASGATIPGDVCVALAIAAVGIVLLAGIPAIGLGAGYDRIGPRFFPYFVAIGAILNGVWIVLSTIRSRRAPDELAGRFECGAATDPVQWGTVANLGLAFGVAVVLLERAGFVIAAGLQFWLVARAFRSGRPARDAVIAACLSLAVYLLFSGGLGLHLPTGTLF